MAKVNKSSVYKILISLVILIIIIGGFLYMRHKRAEKPAAVGATVPVVKLAKVSYQTAPLTVSAYGSTVSPDSVAIEAKNSGVVAAIYFQPGQHVAKGQTLFQIHSTDINNQLTKLKADLAADKSRYESYVRANQEAPGSIAANDLDKAKSNYVGTLASYYALRGAVYVKSPITGIVSDTNLAVGDSVKEGDSLLNIIDEKSLQVKYELDNQYAHQVKVGQSISFQPTNTKTKFKGAVAYVSPLMSDQDQNLVLRANLDNPTALDSNVFGEVKQVLDANHRMLMLSQALIQTDSEGFYVYGIDSGKVTKIYFKPGDFTGKGMVAVKSGLSFGTPIIVSDTAQLSPGQYVKVSN